MKSNVKRFLSTLCVVTSIFGVVAPNLVSAVYPEVQDYSTLLDDLRLCDECKVDESCINNIINELRSENHQEFYNKIIRLKDSGLVKSFAAVMLIVINQTQKSGCEESWTEIEFKEDWFLSNDKVKEMAHTENWRYGVEQLMDIAKNDVSLNIDKLGYRALRIFDYLISRRIKLNNALTSLDPSNPKGL